MKSNSLELARSTLYVALNNKLMTLSPLHEASFDSEVWQFATDSGKNRVSTLDFSLFNLPHLKFKERITVQYDGSNIEIFTIDLAKVLWLHMVEGLSPRSQSYLGTYNCLALLFTFLSEEGLSSLLPSGLEGFFAFCMTQNIGKDGVTRRLTVPSYGNRLECFSIDKLRYILLRYGINNVLGNISKRRVNEALTATCLDIMNMTASEYKQGGTYNFLGLDIGKHYLDHCSNVFEEHFGFITAIKETIDLSLSGRLFADIDYIPSSLSRIVVDILTGENPPKRSRHNRYQIEKYISIQHTVHDLFRKAYEKSCKLSHPFFIDNINKIIERSGFPERYDTQEFVRSLLYVDIFGESSKSKESIWQEYMAYLGDQNNSEKVTLSSFEKIVKIVVDDSIKNLPDTSDGLQAFLKNQLDKLGASKFKSKKKSLIIRLADRVSYAGTTCFIGATGWRASEFDFSLKNIEIIQNDDVLDNHYTPWRFHVFWKVPKTSGETKLKREITLGSYIIASQVAHLRQLNTSESIFPSPDISVREWWCDFVEHYCLFEARHENDDQIGKYSSLIDLTSIHKKLLKELPVISMTITRYGEGYFMNCIRRLKEGRLNNPKKQVLYDNLSEATLNFALQRVDRLEKADILAIRAELIGDASYPTPHAFRHIWAEAVFHRYRGDVGKFIRSNFKHMNSRFFMAYLRGKEFKGITQVAERNFINNVVRQHIDSLGYAHRDYAGGTDRFLERVISRTKTVTEEERNELIRNLCENRIVSAQSNPWATCLLRSGTMRMAKCSSGGIPQRHNASPSLCLDCIHADITEGNFNGIVVYIKPDIEACRSPSLPYVIKQYHIGTVRSALKRVSELRRNGGNEKYDTFIKYLIESLDLAENTRSNTE